MAEDRKTFLQHAADAEANAARAIDANVKRQFLEIAEQWRRLADPKLGRWNRLPKDGGDT
jgi:hypothetical protein